MAGTSASATAGCGFLGLLLWILLTKPALPALISTQIRIKLSPCHIQARRDEKVLICCVEPSPNIVLALLIWLPPISMPLWTMWKILVLGMGPNSLSSSAIVTGLLSSNKLCFFWVRNQMLPSSETALWSNKDNQKNHHCVIVPDEQQLHCPSA